MNDYTSRMVGYGLVRQLRVTNNSCKIPAVFSKNLTVSFCFADYSPANEDSTNYGFSWSKFNSSYTPPFGMEQLYSAFQYNDAETLQGYDFGGDYNVYSGAGYVYQLRGNLAYLKGNLSQLQQMGWIDRQTRAVFVEFAVYNPNINLIMVSTILAEVCLFLFSCYQNNNFKLKLQLIKYSFITSFFQLESYSLKVVSILSISSMN